MYLSFQVNDQLFLSDLNESLIFFYIFSQNTQIANFTKARRVGVQLFHEEGQTDKT
jgi:hypothetical protein